MHRAKPGRDPRRSGDGGVTASRGGAGSAAVVVRGFGSVRPPAGEPPVSGDRGDQDRDPEDHEKFHTGRVPGTGPPNQDPPATTRTCFNSGSEASGMFIPRSCPVRR